MNGAPLHPEIPLTVRSHWLHVKWCNINKLNVRLETGYRSKPLMFLPKLFSKDFRQNESLYLFYIWCTIRDFFIFIFWSLLSKPKKKTDVSLLMFPLFSISASTWQMNPVEEHCRTQRLNFLFFLFLSSRSVQVVMNTGSSSISGSCRTCKHTSLVAEHPTVCWMSFYVTTEWVQKVLLE